MRVLMLLVGLLLAMVALGAQAAMKAGPNMAGPGHHRLRSAERSAAEIMAAATLDLNFAAGTYRQTGVPACTSVATCVTVTRAGAGATNLLSTSPPGAAYTTYAADQPRVVPGSGILVETTRTNRFFNSAVPATQTRNLVAAGPQVLWMNGTGSVTVGPGTATGCGTGVATHGNPVFFTLTTGGTCSFTVAGAVNAMQVEAGDVPSSFIVTGGAIETRTGEVVTVISPPAIGPAFSIACQGTTTMNTAGNQTLASISDGTAASHVLCRRLATTGNMGMQATGWGFTDIVTAPPGVLKKLAGAVNGSNEQAGAFDSGYAETTYAGNPTGLNTIKIGVQGNNAVAFGGYIGRFTYWPVRLSNNDLLKVVQ